MLLERISWPVPLNVVSSAVPSHLVRSAVASNRPRHSPAPDMPWQGVLLKGDNLEFLSLAQSFLRSQVRLIYIDPPYNTGNKEHLYRDSYERDEWLRYMEQRLSLSIPLLSDNGSICLSIDDNEMPHMRLLMDKLFGEKCFVACIAYERSGSAGLGQSGVILNSKEYILIYSKDKRSLNDIGYERPLDHATMKRYNKILAAEGTRRLLNEFEVGGNVARLYGHANFSILSISLRNYLLRQDEVASQYIENFERIFRTQNVQKENTFQNRIIDGLEKNVLYSLDYVPSRGRYRGSNKTLYYWNGELCAWLKDSAAIAGDTIIKRNKLTDFWSHEEIPKADLANEGGVLFSRSKKP